MTSEAGAIIREGRTILGIELGSTRIKAVLIGPDHQPLAVGGHDWENQLVDGMWTYSLDSVWSGLRACYAALTDQVRARYDVPVTTVAAMGVSAMMHGYLAFDAQDRLLTPFRTWRNTNTQAAVDHLTAAFDVNIPHRWSVAHLYQAILDDEDHVPQLTHLTTLAGYVHWQLTGQKTLGIGDASGMFPIDTTTNDYHAGMLERFDQLAADAGHPLTLATLLPDTRIAGQPAGALTADGAAWLDPSGQLRPGIPLCPPEGDAGTGMVATNAVAPRTANVSGGTSIFAMIVLEHQLAGLHRELDLVTTPAADPVAMVHCNNGASELDSWVSLFTEFAEVIGAPADRAQIFETLFRSALDGAPDCDGLMAYTYQSGEPIADTVEGRPLFFRTPNSALTLANFTRAQLFATLATLRIGLDVLTRDEGVQIDHLVAHGGMFKTAGVAQRFLAAALDTPVAVGSSAGEGGAWGIALLAAYRTDPDRSLAEYLRTNVFTTEETELATPDPDDVAGFAAFTDRYIASLPVEKTAIRLS